MYSEAVDRGLEGVVACTTSISSIVDATLCYRGYKIEDICEKANSFEEVAYLLWKDTIPSQSELSGFRSQLQKEMKLPSGIVNVLKEIPYKDVHPMAWLRSAVSLLAHWDEDAQSTDTKDQETVAFRLTSRTLLLVAYLNCLRKGFEFGSPQPEKGMAWNFLYLLKGQKEPSAYEVKVFDTCLILHADHELNCSAFATRVTSSSLSDIYSAVVSGIGALKGPLHGGANEQVMKMLSKMNSVEEAQAWVKDALVRKEKIMGFGHRVYKNGDPRAKILKSMSKKLTEEKNQPLYYQMSEAIEDVVVGEKGLLPNVDFYSATVYNSMEIETDLFTPIFAVSRMTGWLAHIFEQYSKNRIYRPRGQWVGADQRTWS